MSPPRQNLAPRVLSPLPQEGARHAVQAVNIVDAFYQFLPPKSLTFFKRSYAAFMPCPLIPAFANATPAFPRIVPMSRITLPQQRVLVFQDVVFTAYRSTNIDPSDYAPLTPFENKRLLGFVGYNLTIGGRGIMDANTNIGSYAASTGSAGSGSVPEFPIPGAPALSSSASSTSLPYQGSLADGTRGFAAYGMPGQVIEASAVLLRLPPFEISRFTVDISGYLLNETHYNRILENTR
jgi:hypothetical protein